LREPRLRHGLKYLGPGAVIASVTIGSGELVWAPRSGAVFGTSMLWCFLYAGLFKAVQVYTGFRYLTLTGEHPLTAWRSMPGLRGAFPLLIILPIVPIMPIAFSAVAETLGTFLGGLAGGPATEFAVNGWATAVLVACFALALASNDSLLEKASLAVLVGMLGCTAVTVIVSAPSVADVARGLFVPRVGEYPAWIRTEPSTAAAFAGRSPWLEVALYLWAVGGGTQDYVGYVSMARERGWGRAGAGEGRLPATVGPEDRGRARAWLLAPLLDTVLSFASVIAVTVLFAVLGAQLLAPRHVVPGGNDFLGLQERFLTFLHPGLRWLYRAGVLLALVGTLYGAFRVYSLTAAESVRAVVPRWGPDPARPSWNRGFYAALLLASVALVWLPSAVAGDVVGRLSFATVIGGASSCGLWCFAMLWADRARVPAPLRMGWPLRVLVGATGVVMSALGVQSAVAYFS
jgi:hypothetical protein